MPGTSTARRGSTCATSSSEPTPERRRFESGGPARQPRGPSPWSLILKSRSRGSCPRLRRTTSRCSRSKPAAPCTRPWSPAIGSAELPRRWSRWCPTSSRWWSAPCTTSIAPDRAAAPLFFGGRACGSGAEHTRGPSRRRGCGRRPRRLRLTIAPGALPARRMGEGRCRVPSRTLSTTP